jgi:endonuclease YncB( thermonuclease family)
MPSEVAAEPYKYDGTVVRVIDGDTVVLRLTKTFELTQDVGFHVKATVVHTATIEQTFRLLGIDTPEMVGATRPAGLTAKAALTLLLQDRPLRVTSYKGDKYGRWLCTIEVRTESGDLVNANDYMLEHGYARPYDGTSSRA